MSDMNISIVLKAIDRATAPIRKVSRSMSGFATDVKKLDQAIEKNLARRAALRGQLMDAAALGATLFAPLKAAVDFESAMADVGKVVDFKNPDGLEKMGNAIKRMSREIPISADGLAQIVAAGGQLGIAEGDLATFARTASKMSVAFDLMPAEAGDAMAKLSNVFNIPIGEVGSLGNAINHLSDNTAAKAPEIVRALLRVGGTAKSFGLSAVQTSALADAFIALGKPPEVAGTAINALLMKLQTASTQGSKFQGTLKHLGLSASALEKSIGEDAQGALLDFLNRLGELNKADKAKATALLFGQEYADDIALLVGSLDKYQQALRLTADETNYAGSMTREFENRSKTTNNALQLLKNGVTGIGINLGSTLLPGLNNVIGALHSATGAIAGFTEKFPLITQAVSTLAAVLITGKVATVGFGFALTFLKGGALSVVKNLKSIVAVMNVLRIAMIANPVGALVTLLITGATLIVAYWEPINKLLSDIGARIKSLADSVLPDWLKEKLGFGGDSGSKSTQLSPGAPAKSLAGAPARATTPTGVNRSEVGGEVRIVIDQDGRARVAGVESDSRGFDLNVDAGLVMAGP